MGTSVDQHLAIAPPASIFIREASMDLAEYSAAGVRSLVLDFACVRQLDALAAPELVRLFLAAMARDIQLRVVNACPAVEQEIADSGLGELVGIHASSP